MANFAQALRDGVQNAFCAGLDGITAGGLLLGGLIDGLPGSDAVRDFGASGTQFMYNRFCNRPLPRAAMPVAQFNGGQCYGLQYTVRVNYTAKAKPGSGATDVNATDTFIRFRRILGSFVEQVGSGKEVGFRSQAASGGAITREVVASFADSVYQNVTCRIVSVVPTGGGSDPCGNPPAQNPPVVAPGSNVTNQNITYVNNEGNNITIPVVIAFGYASVNIDGHLEIPLNISGTIEFPVDVNGTLDLSTGDINFNIGDNALPPSGGLPCNPPTTPDGGTPDPVLPLPPSNPLDPEPPGEVEKRRIMRGCIVTTTVVQGKTTVIFQDDDPDIYVPALGYVSFLVQVGSKTAWTTDIPVKNTRQIIECPWEGGAIAVKGTPSYDNEFTVIPVWVTQTLVPQFPT